MLEDGSYPEKLTAALRRDKGFYIPFPPFPASQILLLKHPRIYALCFLFAR